MTDSSTWPSFEERRAGMTPDQRARDEISIYSMIVRMGQAAGVDVQEEPAWPGAASTLYRVPSLDGIRYALMIRNEAFNQLHSYMRHAREEGTGWREIGEALGLAEVATQDGRSLAEMAFEYVVDAEHARPFDRLAFYWTCAACGQTVTDRGPYESHPVDNEEGHADGCGWMAAAVAEHETRMAEWEER